MAERIVPPVVEPSAGQERVHQWMAWKSAKSLGERVTRQVEKAAKRGSRGTTVPLGDLRALLALIEPGMEPK